MKSNVDVAFILMGSYNVLSKGPTVVSENRESVVEEVTGVGEETDRWGAVKHRRFEMTQEGFYDLGAARWHEALELEPVVLMYAPVGNEIGDELIAFDGARTVYNRLPARGEFTKANATYKAEGMAYAETKIAAPFENVEGDGETDSYNWTAAADDGIIFLSVTDLDLDTGSAFDVKVEHSINDSDWDDLASFTTVTGATAESKIVGEIRQYTKVSWTFTGGAGGENATICVGIGRN